MKKNTLFIKMACGITAAALVVGAVGVSTYQSHSVPGVVEAEEKATGKTSTDEEDAKTLEKAVTSAVEAAGGTTDGVEKEETVYIFADNDGKTEDTVVSSWLKNTNNENLISDESNLSDIENVKGDEDYTQNGNTITWDSDGNDIYYQGTSNAESPVGVKVSYKLNGKEVSADEIAGKSGKVTIRFDYTNDAKTVVDGEETTVPFTMITGVLLPTENFKNVTVSNGQVMSEGNNSIALGYTFPGLADAINLNKLEEDAKEATGKSSDVDLPDYLEIEADATDFSLDMTMTVGLPNVLSQVLGNEDSGLDDLESTLNDLNTGIDELTDGTSQLADGSSQLADGTQALATGTSQLYNGAAELSSGAGALKNQGTQALADGANTLNSNSSALNNGASDLSNGAAELSTGAGTLSSGANDLASGASTLNSNLNNDTVNTQLSALESGSDQVASGVSSYAAGVQQYMNNVNTSTATLTSGLTTIVTNEATIIGVGATAVGQTSLKPLSSDDLATIITKGQSVSAALQTAISASTDTTQNATLTGYYTDVNSAISTLNTIAAIQSGQTVTAEQQQALDQLQAYTAAFQSTDTNTNSVLQYTNGVKSLVSSFRQVQTAAGQLSSGATSLAGGASTLANGAGTLASGASTLKTGVNSYTNGVGSLASGATEVNNNMTKLTSGTSILMAGIAELNSGADTLNTGANALSTGAGQLDEGVDELAGGVKDMDMSTSVTQLRKVITSGDNYDNFSGKSENTTSKVKFIIKTDGIKNE